MNLWTVLAELAALLQQYGPLALAAEAAFVKGGWVGLLAYLESLVKTPVTPGPAPEAVASVVARLKAAGVK